MLTTCQRGKRSALYIDYNKNKQTNIMAKKRKVEVLTEVEKQAIILKYDLDIKPNITIEDNGDSVTCRICGEQSKRVYGAHMRNTHNGITSQEYLELFDNPPISCSKDKVNISKNGGQHMKLDKYKKMFSEKVKGENNPMHRSNTTDEFRKSVSPFSIDFYNLRYPDVTQSERECMLVEFRTGAFSDRVMTSQIEYYLNQGMSQKEAELALSERQTTFSKKICIEKHGEEEGHKVWMDRQERWLKNLPRLNYSKISQVLFIEVWKEVKYLYEDIYFATLDKTTETIYQGDDRNFEFRLNLDKSFIKPDFYIPSISKIIEFDGSYYHRDSPERYERDKNRDLNIINKDIDLLHVKELDFNNDNETVIKKCIDFILERGEFSK